MSHTPGPWAWQKFGNEYCLTGQHSMRPIVLAAQGSPGMGYCERCQDEADVIGGSTHLTSRNAEKDLLIPLDPEHPDAKLIAAAPELLEACQAAELAIDPYAGTNGSAAEHIRNNSERAAKELFVAFKQLRTAIAKATETT